jgi:hypothetical protein
VNEQSTEVPTTGPVNGAVIDFWTTSPTRLQSWWTNSPFSPETWVDDTHLNYHSTEVLTTERPGLIVHVDPDCCDGDTVQTNNISRSWLLGRWYPSVLIVHWGPDYWVSDIILECTLRSWLLDQWYPTVLIVHRYPDYWTSDTLLY